MPHQRQYTLWFVYQKKVVCKRKVREKEKRRKGGKGLERKGRKEERRGNERERKRRREQGRGGEIAFQREKRDKAMILTQDSFAYIPQPGVVKKNVRK